MKQTTETIYNGQDFIIENGISPQEHDIQEPQTSVKWKNCRIIIYTIALYHTFISVGLCSSIFNPTLLQLSHIFGTNLQTVSIIFPLRAIGCTVGTLTNGLLNLYFNRQILLISFLILKSLTTFLVPHWTSVQQFYVNSFFNGFFTAAVIVMVNVWLNEMWSRSSRDSDRSDQTEMDEEVTPENSKSKRRNLGNVLMQALHFFFGCGTILGPLVAEPFLSNPFQGFDNQFVSNNLVWPYTIAATMATTSALSFFVLYLAIPYNQPSKCLEKTESTIIEFDNESSVDQHHNQKMLRNLVIFSCALFLAMFACSEGTYLQFSATFCSKTKLNLTQSQSALVSSALAISFTIFRGLSILIAIYLAPKIMILLDLIIITIGNLLVFLFADKNLYLLYFGYILLGAGFSSVFPSLFPLLEQKGYIVTDWIGSLITFSSGAAQVMAPFIIGLLIDQQPFVLVYFTFISVICSFIVFAIMHLLIKIDHKSKRQQQQPAASTITS